MQGSTPRSMVSRAVALVAGAYAVSLCRMLPPFDLLPVVGAVTAVALCAVPACRRIGPVLLGFAVCWGAAADVIADRLDPALERVDLERVFRVADFVDSRSETVRLLVTPLDDPGLPRRIRLSWYDAADVPRFGECWRLNVRLRRPRGMANPGSFDYERWLFRSGIGASGYVRRGVRAVDCPPAEFLDRARAALSGRLIERLPDDDAAAILSAITVGARQRITREQWQRYAVTGTSHLMAISGMHIGLAAGSAWLLARLLLLGCGPRGSHRDRALLAALLAALSYATLSGFAIPARRAAMMVAIATGAAVARRPAAAGHLLGVTCFCAVLLDPISVFAPGFQLSFAAVAILMWLSRRRGAVPEPDGRSTALRPRLVARLRRLVGLQFGLLFGLFALTLATFGRLAWLAPLVNLLVLPVFNLVTVPAALLGTALDGPVARLGDGLLHAAWLSVHWMLDIIRLASDLPGAGVDLAAPGGLSLLAAWCGAAWIALPVGWPGRRIAILALIAALYAAPVRPPPGCADLHVLDVGQGTAVVVRTQRHAIVFDTGPAFRSGSDTGALVVSPFLRSLGVQRADLLIISHADNDHAGGVASVLRAVEIGALLTGEPLVAAGTPQYPCAGGQLWEWDGVRFRILQPPAERRREGNNASCVLEIEAGGVRALLTGDIEAVTERELVRQRLLSPSELVVIPHHGSSTSSHRRFVDVLSPRVAVATAGFDNRWGMPKPDVSERWRGVGARLIETASSGAVAFRMCARSGLEMRAEHRSRSRRIWHEP